MNNNSITGRKYNKKADIYSTKAMKSLHEAAEKGNSEVQYILGDCYRYGNRVKSNNDEALKWMGKCAEQGHPGA